MSPILYLLLGLLPSLIWLIYYLRKDAHPEPKKMILQVFLLGMLSSIIAAFLESIPIKILSSEEMMKDLPPLFSSIVSSTEGRFFLIFFMVALIEECLKYLVVRIRILRDTEFNEPVDAMIYMITAAMGFAALENILIFFSPKKIPLSMIEGLTLVGLRFAFATFLHALCSGIVGYFLALYCFRAKERKRTLLAGLGFAIILHWLYNFSIIVIAEEFNLYIPIFILSFLAIAVSKGFKSLREKPGICQTEALQISKKQKKIK